MKSTPIFDELSAWRDQMFATARLEARVEVAKALREIKKPSKQIQEIIKELENADSKS